MSRLVTLLVVALLLLPATAVAQRKAKPQPLDGLADYIEQARKDWKVPGLAIAIVKDDSIVVMRGFGVRELGKPEPVDAHTVFAIGSCSKAFTATLIAMLVDQGKLRWDDPVTKYLTGFQLYDPYVTRELTIRDLLSHRSGLSRGDLSWYASGHDRADVLRRIRYLKPSSSFRSKYGYQNIMFSAAGEIVGKKVEGTSWDKAVRERIFLPLGMLESSTSITALEGRTDVAAPYAEVNDTVRLIKLMNIDNIGPAGSINSSVFDMAQWIRFQLNQGLGAGRQMLSVKNLEETHSPQTVIPRDRDFEKVNPNTHLRAYGLGWVLSDYRGRLIVSHGGNIDGMSAQVTLMPEEKLGFVILSNLDNSGLRTPLNYRIFDSFLGAPSRDWSKDLLQRRDSIDADSKAETAKEDSARVPGTSPSLPLAQYEGTYTDSLYGDVVIQVENDHLVARFGPLFIGDLEHWNYDTFRVIWRDPYYGKNKVTFVLGQDGKVSEL
ncbi:MAG TPA: serine hydrolase, partial [Gemmatimonadales bacterium]|nr:serine hydrolase [Gemmatimonadales bacterium]